MKNRHFSLFFDAEGTFFSSIRRSIRIFCLLTLATPVIGYTKVTELFPKGAPASFQINEQASVNGTPLATIKLQGLPGTYPRLAPLDKNARPDCHQLQEELLDTFKLDHSQMTFACSRAPRAETAISLTLKEKPEWKLARITWNTGWITLTGTLKSSISVDKEQVQDLLSNQNKMLETSSLLAKKWPGLGMDNKSLPASAWAFLTGSKGALFNGLVVAWHGFELYNHGTDSLHALKNGKMSSLSFNLLALILHTLEGLEHADNTALGNYAHLNFRGDIIKASPAPHATNISLSGTSLLLAVAGLLTHDHDHGGGHSHGGHDHAPSKIGTAIYIFERLHILHHLYEFSDALSSWYYGEDPHEHHH
ncbi:hypothetical protein [Parendozoicomonas sp. Alg238-R29]|uniref:hypothetical protein n=1 Tax=Parendozoicomonas sp. Alg238-R29 TaxID=2993446 RepID=UPI00248D4327|nr:hypothetical protein [Parendozoicomonas sp. Alg238-R29]